MVSSSHKISFSRTWLAVPDNFLESIGQSGAIVGLLFFFFPLKAT